jgi:hypothetical protein
MVLASLPRVSEALERDIRQASISVTCEFRYGAGDVLQVTMNPRERIPLTPVQIKLTVQDGQLSLFQGAPIEPEPEPVPNEGAIEPGDGDAPQEE